MPLAAAVAGASAAGATLTATLYDPDGVEVVSTTTSGAAPTGVLEVRSPSLWTAETPSLYSLVYELADADGTVTETLGTRVGIREFAIVDGVMTLNGRPLDIKGVNRGEMHPDVGQAMTEEVMRADLTAMKRANITAVRTSHYPAHPMLYALADEIGLYVMDEANVESHDQRPFPGDSPAWSAAVLDRVTSMYERDKNHASVLWWSLGNEAGSGQVFQDAADWLRDADSTRLVHYQDDYSVADIDGVFYPSVSDVRERAEQTTARPWIMTEYQMVMGNAVAGMTEYWDAIDSNPEMQGGFIWDWADQAIRVPLDGGFVALPVGETADADTYLSYGGDWGDGATDGGFSLNGLVNPDRVAQPELAAVAAVYAPFEIDTADAALGTVGICNESLVTDLDEYAVTWTREVDGAAVATGGLDWDLAAGECGTLALPAEATSVASADAGTTVALTLAVALAEDTTWAEAGHVVASQQAVLRDAGVPAEATPATSEADGVLDVASADGTLTVTGERVDVEIDEAAGVVTSAVLDGVLVVEGSIGPDFWRAPTQNDLMNGLADGAHTWHDAVREPDAVEVTRPDDATVVIDTSYTLSVAGKPGARMTTTVRADGTIEVAMAYAGSDQAREIPAVGTALTLPGDLTALTWFGDGPGASYRDRTEGTALGRWSSTVDDSLFPHVVPQA
ncbi:MAG: glycoside hydrolase family 2 TIM barrel-domain containing protein, partial [Demequina sp.]|uniref:glycoside hydrolase family 2 TIM barrel-domain containing protein n=1 Tax=Demequina sp. TaxID=2050685 RepID=UPI003A869833